ncbi:M56 family metallopeptidase [Larkinella bovis]|uniref:M56 family metallopeptidase n=1 Tax=Larkinella bovis TaxID=683041 RepID=A0ABW0I7W6_9BACT
MNTFQLFSEPLTTALGWALVHTLWQGVLLTALAALALRWTARMSSDVRYGLGIGALALQVLVFLGTVWICYEPVIPSVSFGSEQPSTMAQPVLITRDASGHGWSGSLTEWLHQHLSLLVMIWQLGSALLLIRLAGGWLLVQRLTLRNVRSAPEAWQAYTHQLACRLGMVQAVRLVESADISVPMTIGWLKPVILLPIGLLTGLSPKQVEAVLVHELAHIRRYDYLVNLIQSVVEIVLFFHPAIWWLSARIRQEREHCCDDRAIRVCGERTSLAQALVHIEGRRQTAWPAPELAMAFGARKQSLLQRVKRVIGVSEPQSSVTPNGLVVAGCLLLLTGLVTAQHLYQPVHPGRREGDSVSSTAGKAGPAGPEGKEAGKPGLEAVVRDTIDPVKRATLENTLNEHERELERLNEEIEQWHKPMEQVDRQMERESQSLALFDSEMELLDRKLEGVQKELEQNLEKSLDLELKKNRLNGKLSQAESRLLAKMKQDEVQIRKKMEALHHDNMAKIQANRQALEEGQQKLLNDSMEIFVAKMAQIAEKSSFHATEMMRLQAILGRLDTLPDPVPAVAPKAPIGPARAGKPAGAKGGYWYNGKRYERPEDMPAAPTAPTPPPAVMPAAPTPPTPPVVAPAAPAPPDAPAAPQAPKSGKKGKSVQN